MKMVTITICIKTTCFLENRTIIAMPLEILFVPYDMRFSEIYVGIVGWIGQ